MSEQEEEEEKEEEKEEEEEEEGKRTIRNGWSLIRQIMNDRGST